jgi:transposase InsO family protein
MCEVLKVSASGYYGGLEREPSVARRQHNQQLTCAVTRSYLDSDKSYGYRKVWEDLRAWSMTCCPETVRRVMKRLGFYAQYKRRFVVTTDSNHGYAVAENLLNRDFYADAPDQKWVADITYIPTQEGWLYLAAVLDLFSRRIVGWATSERIDEALVTSALNNAITWRHPGPGLLHHSDRGSQYAADGYQRLLEQMGMVCSMSRKGNCWDNAVMERFFRSLKTERVYRKLYKTRAEARKDLFMYIEWFYNAGRRHAALGYQTPNAVETRYRRESQVA